MEKYGTKKSKERREEPLGTRSYQTNSKRRRSGFWLVPENFCVYLPYQKPEWRRPFGTGLVRHCPQGLFSPFFTFLRAIFSRPFRLSLAPIICPWVSEDGSFHDHGRYIGMSVAREKSLEQIHNNKQPLPFTLFMTGRC